MSRACPWLLLLLILVPPVRAIEGEGLDFKYMYYWDRNKVWNHTPAFTLLRKVADLWSLGWQQEFDGVSGASRRLGLRNIGRQGESHLGLDAISGASRREVRHSEKATLAYANGPRTGSASFYFSDENDYTSFSPALGGSWDFNERNTTLGTDLAFFYDRFRPLGGFAGLGGDRRITSMTLDLAQVLTPLTLAAITFNGIRSTGYLGHPYNPVILPNGNMILENLPDTKTSLAVSGQLIQGYRLSGRLGSLRLEGRYYQDSWKLSSNTAEVQWYQYLTAQTYFRLRARGYQQGAAGFAQHAYIGNELYRTADIRLYEFSSLSMGFKIGSTFFESWGQSALLPDRWDLSYDHGHRDTRGEGGLITPSYRYQIYDHSQYYMQGTFMLGLGFDL